MNDNKAKWNPAATAPKDGRLIIGLFGDDDDAEYAICFWDDGAPANPSNPCEIDLESGWIGSPSDECIEDEMFAWSEFGAHPSFPNLPSKRNPNNEERGLTQDHVAAVMMTENHEVGCPSHIWFRLFDEHGNPTQPCDDSEYDRRVSFAEHEAQKDAERLRRDGAA